jgi:serine phosphatase RsbU (regulator of sigma subunit)/anti-sigma regulatory factor (Ser/Thr protein kinase)
MNDNAASAARREQRTSLRIEAACEFSGVRAAVLAVRDWLAEKGLPEADLGAWELALAEASNNAAKYAAAESRCFPVTIEISCGEHDIEARITDHTAGFDWPDKVNLPGMDSESGRGLFLIKSLTDHVAYLRGSGLNEMILRRARPVSVKIFLPDAGNLQRQLAEAEAALADMTSELASSYESLVALFRYSSELGAQPDLKDFSDRLLKDLMQLAEADCAVLRLVSPDGKKLGTLLALPGDGKSPPPAAALADASGSVEACAAQKRQDIWFGPEEPLAKNDPLRAVMPAGNGVCHAFFVANQLVGTATLGRMMADKPFTAAQVNLLHTFIDFLAIQIVNARLLDERTIARVTQRELEIAADIQRSLLPSEIPACRPFELSAACQSALQVGGDFFDLIPAADGALLLVIADVMGKGVPAALFAAVLRSTLRSMPQLFAEPGELLAAANRTLFPDLSRVDMFVTAQVAYLNPQRQQIISASAGHCPLLVWQPGAKEAVALGQSGFPLGIEPLTRYAQIETFLPPKSAALLHTDGLSETRNVAGEMLGEKKLLQFLAQTAAQTGDAAAGKNFLLSCLADFCGPAPMTDDQTLILIRHNS